MFNKEHLDLIYEWAENEILSKDYSDSAIWDKTREIIQIIDDHRAEQKKIRDEVDSYMKTWDKFLGWLTG